MRDIEQREMSRSPGPRWVHAYHQQPCPSREGLGRESSSVRQFCCRVRRKPSTYSGPLPPSRRWSLCGWQSKWTSQGLWLTTHVEARTISPVERFLRSGIILRVTGCGVPVAFPPLPPPSPLVTVHGFYTIRRPHAGSEKSGTEVAIAHVLLSPGGSTTGQLPAAPP
jgi:hypothetical protein